MRLAILLLMFTYLPCWLGAQSLRLDDLMRLTIASPADLKPFLVQKGFEARLSGDLSEQFYVKQKGAGQTAHFEQVEYHQRVNVLQASGEVRVRDNPELYYFIRNEHAYIDLKNEVALLLQSGKLESFGTAPDLLYFHQDYYVTISLRQLEGANLSWKIEIRGLGAP